MGYKEIEIEIALREQMPKLKEATKKQVELEFMTKWNDKVKSLVYQGDFINLLVLHGKVLFMVCPGVAWGLQ